MLTSSVRHREDRESTPESCGFGSTAETCPMDKPESILAVVMVGTNHAAINGDRSGLNQPKNSKHMRINGAKGESSQDVPT